MSGQIVGEVLAASDTLRARGLPPRAFYALIAIAEKAHHETRQASVRWAHIQAALYSGQRDKTGNLNRASLRSAERAVAELKRAGVVAVVRRGFNNGHGRAAAPVYRIEPLTVPASGLAETVEGVPASELAETRAIVPAKLETVPAKLDDRSRQTTGGLDGPIDGSTDGGARAAVVDADVPPPRYCSGHPDGTPDGCIPCKHARLKLEQWEQDHRDREQAEREARTLARQRCERCEGTGQIEVADNVVDWCPECSAWRRAARQ